MPVWVGIVLAMVAAAATNVGLVLQKKGLEEVAAAGDAMRLRQCRTWRWGISLMIGGYGIFIIATAIKAAPISLLQPLFGSGLLVVALLAVFWLGERFHAVEWIGVGVMAASVGLLGASAERGAWHGDMIHLTRLLAFLGGALVLAAVFYALETRLPPGESREVLVGIMTGALLGVGYLNTKAFTLSTLDGRWLAMLVTGPPMVGGLLGGLISLQYALRRGRALIVTSVNLVTNQALVVTGGLWCLAETLPEDPFKRAARLAGLGGVIVGTLLLARVSSRRAGKPLP